MNKEVDILVSIKTFSNKSTQDFRNVLSKMQDCCKIEAISSVYRVSRPAESFASIRDIRRDEYIDGLALVFKAKCTKSAQHALQEFEKIESSLQREALKRTISINLLFYGSDVLMTPGLSIPHPEMHLRPEEIVPAVEVWPDYKHPVLGESLSMLAQRFANSNWGEFFTQGAGLLDF